jgi:hypothetical protein
MTPKGILLSVLLALVAVTPDARGMPPVPIDYFFEEGCDSCRKIRSEVLPELEFRYSGVYVLLEHDIGIKSNYLALVAYQDALGVKDNEPVSMVVGGREWLAGFPRIRDGLFPALERAVGRQLQSESSPSPAPVSGPVEPGALLQRRLHSFTLAAVAAAALVDSINPCAIATLVFFMSLLSVARLGVGRMWLAGLAFLTGSFVAYVAIGFGLLGVLQLLPAGRGLRLLVDWGIGGILLVFAFLSFRDAVRYHRSGQPGDVALKLPAGLQDRIHRVMKSGLRKRNLVLGGFGIGVVVTALESVCTGQVYVPTLVLMLKQGESVLRCSMYLMVYNVIFVLPLAVTLALTCGGMSTPALVEWSRRNVTVSKTLLGLFFLAMAGLLVVLR